MSREDPTRLGEGADPGASAFLREALAAAREDGPSAEEIARLAARLPLGGPPTGAPPAAPGAGAAAATPSVLSGALIGAALGVLVTGAGFVWDARRDGAASEPAAMRAPVVAVQSAPRVTVSPAPAAPTPVAAPAPENRTAPARAGGRGGGEPQSPIAEPPAPAADAPAAPSDPGVQSEPAGPAPSGGGPAPSGGLATEVDLLQRARDALGRSPAEALALTDTHASRFPGGALAQEREVLAIEALSRLGRAGEARARATRFLSAFPRSAHRPRIDAFVNP